MRTIGAVLFSAALSANPAWLKSSINEKTLVNGHSFEDFLKHGYRRRLRTQREGNVADLFHSKTDHDSSCKVQFELAINQDVSGSFASVVKQFRDNMHGLMGEVSTKFPGSRIGFSSFTDKPVPISGFGDHGGYPKSYYRDHCYKLRSPLTSDADALSHAMNDVNISGGGDYRENILGSLVSIANDPTWGFSTGLSGGDSDQTAMIRVVLSTTDALPHTAGDAKRNIQDWNENWGTDHFHDAWTLHYGPCRKGSDTYKELLVLRAKHEAGTLKGADSERFDEIVAACGPWPFFGDLTDHGSVVDTPDNCLRHEYPTVEETMTAMKSMEAMVPVVVTPSANAGFDYVKYYGNCPHATSESECLREHYQKLFEDAGVQGLFYSLEGDNIPTINEIILFALDSIKYMYCQGELFPTPSGVPAKTAAQEVEVTSSSESSAVTEGTTLADRVPRSVPTSGSEPCGCAGNVCPCDQEMRIHVGVDVPISKWEAFLEVFSPWVKRTQPLIERAKTI